MLVSNGRAQDDLVIHDWGSFICLQDEEGKAIGGINTDGEPVPDFVYDVTTGSRLLPGEQLKGVGRCHPDITMRIEPRFICFYPPDDFHSRVDLSVSLSRGWLTQFFPNARASAEGRDQEGFGDLRFLFSRGGVEWRNIALTNSAQLLPAFVQAWTAARIEDAATVEVGGEHEKFLYYQGVGLVDAPLHVVRDGPEFRITKPTNDIPVLWLVDVRPNGAMAFRVVHPFNQAPAFVVKTPAFFAAAEYSSNAADELLEDIRGALIAAGLFENETDAFVEMWKASDFRRRGMRLFFLAPEDHIYERVEVRNASKHKDESIRVRSTRITLGRIEIVTPEQRALLRKLAGHSVHSQSQSLVETYWQEMNERYLQLGRFRNALLLDEQKRNPTPALEQFIQHFHLEAYTPPKSPWLFHRAKARP